MFYCLTAMERITNIKGIYSSPIPGHGILLPAHASTYLDSYSKRALDVATAIVALAVLALLLPLIALLIKTTSRGPVFYIQDRIGRYGVTIKILKFRTMHMDSDSEVEDVQKEAPKSRITVAGKFLRATYLDELPQFWNVLVGDMSLVGPRPEPKAPDLRIRMVITILKTGDSGQMEEGSDRVSRNRLIAKPGITGYTQIKAPHQNNDAILSGRTHVSWALTRLKYDMLYISSCTLMTDLRIVMRTILHILSCRGI